MTDPRTSNFEVVAVSVLLSLILARIIHLFFEWLSKLVEEVVDPEVRHGYYKTKYYLVSAIVSSLFLLFLFALIYTYYSNRLKNEGQIHP